MEEKKTSDLKFTPGSCLAGVALVVVAVIWLVNDGQSFSLAGYEGLKGFGQLFLGVVATLLAAFIVFAIGSSLYQFVLLDALNKWKFTASPLVKALLVSLIATAILWMIK